MHATPIPQGRTPVLNRTPEPTTGPRRGLQNLREDLRKGIHDVGAPPGTGINNVTSGMSLRVSRVGHFRLAFKDGISSQLRGYETLRAGSMYHKGENRSL